MFNLKDNTVQGNLGLAHKFNGDTSSKVKISHNGQIDALLKHRYNDSVNVSFATGFDASGFVSSAKTEKFPIGLQFDVKI